MFSFSFAPLLLVSFQLFYVVEDVGAHGRLMEPPARNAMWRFGFPNPVNWDDNQNWCGGANVMLMQNGGKCGICGDNWATPHPRSHEAGGEFANGIIGQRYSPGQVFNVEIELTANHQGTFQFKLCPAEDPTREVTQDCLDQNVLDIVDPWGVATKTYVITTDEKSKTFFMKLKLPPYLTCSQCILQWTYVAANTWGRCPNGTDATGCGPQETFINCADIAIIPNNGGFAPVPPPKVVPHNVVYQKDKMKNNALVPVVVRYQVCKARTGDEIYVPGLNSWCKQNCMKYPPNCPKDKCSCITDCDAIGKFKRRQWSGAHCMDKCYTYSATQCSPNKCQCTWN